MHVTCVIERSDSACTATLPSVALVMLALLVGCNALKVPVLPTPRAAACRMGAMTDALYAGYGLQPLSDEQRRRGRPSSAGAARTPVEVLALNVKLKKEQSEAAQNLADMLFDVLDRNGDGEVSKEELAAHMLLARYEEDSVDALFDLIDADGNGMMSREELRSAFVRHPSLRSMPGMGTLSKSKRAAVHDEADKTFAAIDRDGNGRLSLEELQAHLAGSEGPSYSQEAVEKIFRGLATKGEVTASEFRGAYVRYRAFRLAFGLNWVSIVNAGAKATAAAKAPVGKAAKAAAKAAAAEAVAGL